MNKKSSMEWFRFATIGDVLIILLLGVVLLDEFTNALHTFNISRSIVFGVYGLVFILFISALSLYRYIVIGAGKEKLIVFSVPLFEVAEIESNEIKSIDTGMMPVLFRKKYLQNDSNQINKCFIGARIISFCLIIRTIDTTYYITWPRRDRRTLERLRNKYNVGAYSRVYSERI
jgi:hypothetical protein